MKRVLGLMVAMLLFGSIGEAKAGAVYVRGSNFGDPDFGPWSQTTNEQAMDLAFGAGNWQDLRYATLSVPTLFSASNSFVYLEGSDGTANELEAFLTANQATIEAWVSAGGSLFLNSAPNEGNGMSFGFGGVSLDFDFGGFSNAAGEVMATNAAHPIFNGPLPTTTNFTGNFFSHASVSGPGLTNLITRVDGTPVAALAEKDFGAGHVIFGGMTTTNFHDPNPEALNLRANILTYGASQANQVSAVPEPATMTMLGFGVAGMLGLGFRRRRAIAA